MKTTIRLLNLCLLLLVFNTRCFNQNKDMPKAEQAVQIEKSDSIKQSLPQTLSETPLVTFIELGSIRCIPCKMMQPIVDEIKKEYAGQVNVIFHDVWTEDGQPYAKQYKITVIPTQIFLDKEGNEYFRHTGFFPKDEIIKVLKQKGVK